MIRNLALGFLLKTSLMKCENIMVLPAAVGKAISVGSSGLVSNQE
jgi:hypothetical protein